MFTTMFTPGSHGIIWNAKLHVLGLDQWWLVSGHASLDDLSLPKLPGSFHKFPTCTWIFMYTIIYKYVYVDIYICVYIYIYIFDTYYIYIYDYDTCI